MTNMTFAEVTTVANAYRIADTYYVSGQFEGNPVTVVAVRDSDHHSATTRRIIEMIDAALAAGDLTEAEMETRGAAVAEQQAAEQARLRAEAEVSRSYAEQRHAAYGSVFQQLDMLYWDMATGSSTWHDHIAAIKARFPKPE